MSFEKQHHVQHQEMVTVRLCLAKNHLHTAQAKIEQALQAVASSKAVVDDSETAPLRDLCDKTTSLLEDLQKVIEARS